MRRIGHFNTTTALVHGYRLLFNFHFPLLASLFSEVTF